MQKPNKKRQGAPYRQRACTSASVKAHAHAKTRARAPVARARTSLASSGAPETAKEKMIRINLKASNFNSKTNYKKIKEFIVLRKEMALRRN